ncbi:MAG: acyl-CoA thioesterase [Phycisphaerales bacterium]|nr:acyl-CoA thioesterase [Phycisphaerales bacterium]
MSELLPGMKPIDCPETPLDGVPPSAFFCRLKVDASATSRSVPHVNNAEYVRWVDRIAELHSDLHGYTRQALLDAGRMWFVARHELDYRAEAFVGDELLLATWVHGYSRTTAHRSTMIVRASDDHCVLKASTRWVYIDLDSRRPIRIPEEMKTHYPPIEPDSAEQP